MTRQEELLAALRDRRLTPEQVLAELSSDVGLARPGERSSAVLSPTWHLWQNEARVPQSGWPILVVDCSTGRAAPAWSTSDRTHRLSTRETQCERRFADLVAQFLVWLQQTIAAHPNTGLRIVALIDSADVGLSRGLAGMFRSVSLERPRLLMQVVQVAREEVVEFGELESCELPGLLRLDGAGLHVQDWNSVADIATAKRPWRDGAAYLISGGGGGLGLLFAAEIARTTQRAHIVLVGRRPATAALDSELTRLSAAGSTAEYRVLDIAQPDEVRRLVREINHSTRPLRGILHCAGVVQDRHLVNKSAAELEAVLRPKVDGILALDEASAGVPLDLFVAFSSLASVYGNAGQCDYAAANGFMDEYVAYRQELVARGERKGRSLSINWPLWRDGGMRTDPSIIAMTAQNVGLEPLDADAGFEALYAALAANVSQAMVLYGDLSKLLPGAATQESAPSATTTARAEGPDRLLAERVMEKVKGLFAQLTMMPPERIDKDEPVERYGVESQVVTALNAEFAKVFGALSQTLIYEHQTLASLADYFCRQHAATCRTWCGLTDAAHPAHDMPTLVEAPPVLQSFREHYAGAARSAAHAHAEPERAAPLAVAIIGISGRYPGARNLDEFWANLEQGKDSVTEIPASRWPADAFFHPDKGGRASVGKYYCRWGGFVDDFAQFDPQFFGISPREAHDMDPQERLFIECCWATIEDAGYTVERLRRRHDSNVGVFVGVTKTGYERYAPQLWEQGDQTKPTTSFGSIANRVSYLLDLRGPSLPLDTMCSASLTALHEACEHLARGECELALAGGVNLYLHPSNFIELCAQGMLSPDGRCKSFGAGANGFVPGEGVGAVLLKPLSRAVADGDHIHAVITSTAINHGGRTNGYTVPNPKAQAALIRRALDRAGIDGRSISYVEAHGTGTELGDPIEVSGLAQAFAHDTDERGFCALGTLKSNIGHLEAAAGIAGLTKIVLQMRHRRLVPTLHSEPVNPKLGLDATPFVLQRTLAPWHASPGAPLRAGLSSFGAGGANAHLVVEEYRAPPAPAGRHRELIFVLSARNKERLQAYAAALLAALPSIDPQRMREVAHTLQIGRDAMAERLAIVASGRDELSDRLRAYLDGATVLDGVYTGRVAAAGDPIGELSGEQDLRPLLKRWLAQQRHAKVLGLWVRGLNLDWPTLLDSGALHTLPLPTYPFEPRTYWFELEPPAKRVSGSAEAAPTVSKTSGENVVPEAGALSGNLLLVPLWNVLSADGHLALRCAGEAHVAARRTLVINGSAAVLEALRTRWPDGEALAVGRDASTDEIVKLLEPQVFARIVWVVPATPCTTLFDDALLDAQADGVRLGFRLLKALLALGAERTALDLRVVTYGTQRVFTNQPIEPTHAAVHGLIATVAKEYPQWSVSLVDLESESDWGDPALTNLEPDPRGRPWACRGGRWYRPMLVPQQGTTPDAAAVYRERGVYVVIGGAGHIGELWSERLVRRHDAQIVWIGRRPLDDAIRARIERAASAGRAPVYLSADATDPVALAQAAQEIRARFGAIHGVVHAALVLNPRSLADLDETEFLSVMDTKLAVAVRVAQVFRDDALDFLLFFSSLVSAIKNAGQSHYAAGCCAADAYAGALADHWRGDGVPRVKVLNWGYWNKLENHASEGFRALESMGIGLIEPDDGLPAVEALLAGTADQIGFMRTTKSVVIEGMSLNEAVLYVAATTPVAIDGVAAALAVAPTRTMLDSIPRGDADDAASMRTLERALSRLLGSELGALAQSHGILTLAELADRIDPTYARWLDASMAILARNDDDAFTLATDRAALWDDWRQTWERPDADAGLRARARLAEAALHALPDILTGRTLATDVLFQDSSMDNVGEVYRGHTLADFFNATVADAIETYARQFTAEATPPARIRILEIGAGTGATSRTVIERIASAALPVAEYCYTDISRAFLMHAEDVYKPLASYLTCRLFDAEKSPVEQGVDPGSFDIVIATNVLHATRDIRLTLRNVKATLRSGGMLVLNEMNSPSNLITHLTFGLTKGWWLFEDAAVRVPGSPGLTPESWKNVLEAEGYADVTCPVEHAHALGQQIVIARSDGTVRVSRGRKARAEAARAASARPVESPVSLDNGAIQARVHDAIIDTLARSLRMDRDDIAGDEPFADFGLDSIIGIGFVRDLNDLLGIKLGTTVIFDYSTTARLTAHIVATCGATLGATMRRTEPAPIDERMPVAQPAVAQLARVAPVAGPSVAVAAPAGRAQRSPIAVIGLAGRFAGSPDLDALWAHLAAGDDLVTPVQRWDLSLYRAAGTQTGGCRYGSFIDHIDRFDPMFFSISGLEASYMDPKQRIFLEECWKALEVAGYAGEAVQGVRCGVYVGNEPGDYNQLFSGQTPGQAMWGVASSVLPARIAYFLDLQGPAISVDTACSSSLVAVHLACQALWGGEIEMALAGGASLESTPGAYVGPGNAGMLSSRGRCYTFDARADGFVPGEGVGAIVLKRLDDALAAGDFVHGVIRGSGLNQDGTTNGITAPSARSQERLECDVYDSFGIDPARIGLVEAHGTGTELGDPIEFNALVQSFRKYTDHVGYCAIGSIKTNIGHAKAAAGIAGLLKILLAFRHRQIPASLHFENVNPNIDFAGSPFRVATTLSEWDPPIDASGRAAPRCAALSAFGMSGTNAHLVLEEAPASAPRDGGSQPHLIVLSAMSAEQLRTVVTRLHDVLAEDATAPIVADVSLTLLLGRRHTEHRLATVVSEAAELRGRLRAWLDHGQHARVLAGYVGGKRRKEASGLRRYGEECLRDCAGVLPDAARTERLEAIAELYVQGYRLDYAALFEHTHARRVPLPVYPFAAESYWVPAPDDAPATPVRPEPAATALHPLLHESVGTPEQPRYRTCFDGSEFFFADHIVNGRRILPGVAHLEMARSAWQHANGATLQTAVRLRNVVWARPLDADGEVVLADVRLVPNAYADDAQFDIASSHRGDDAQVHSQGHVTSFVAQARARLDIAALRAQSPDVPLDRAGYYAMYAALGVDYGPGHRGIDTVYVGGEHALARLHVPAGLAQSERYGLHPALLDSAFQATAALWLRAGGGSQPAVPFALDSLDYLAPFPASVWAWIRDSETPAASDALRKLDIDICDDEGYVCARLRGFTTRVLSTAPAARADAANDVLLFRPQRRVAAAPDSAWSGGSERSILCCGVDFAQVDRLGERLTGVRVDRVDAGADSADTYRRYAVALLGRLAQIQVSRPEAPALLQVIVADDDACASGLNAMLRTARLEQPRLSTQMLVTASTVTTNALLRHLDAAPTDRRDCILLARDGMDRRDATVLDWQRFAAAHGPSPWRSGGVYLITGGMGALGLVFAREIAARADAATVVLAGRSAASTHTDATLHALAALGIRAVYRTVQIDDCAATAQLVASIRNEFGRLDGVIHSAGVAVDRLILNKTAAELTAVFAAKVCGVEAIDAATADLDLDFIALFSSMSGVLGSVGQADYAAANGYLDAFAARRNIAAAAGRRRGRCVSINWPYWIEGGMRTQSGVQEQVYRQHGLGGLSTSAGVDAFYASLACSADQVLVLAGDIARLPAVAESIGTLAPPPPLPAAPNGPPVAGAAEYLRRVVAGVLKLPEARIDVHAEMEKYGIDSIIVMNLTNALEQQFGSLSKTLFYEYQTIAELAGFFERQHADRLSAILKQENPTVHAKTKGGTKSGPQSDLRPIDAESQAEGPRAPQKDGVAGDRDVAIIGMSGRFPQADNLEQFWENLSNGRDCITEVPSWRWDGVAAERDASAAPRWGGFIDGVAEFDPLFFGISPREALVLDPQERLFLQCAFATLEHAGYTRQSLADICVHGIGVYVGVMYEEYPYFAVQAQLAGKPVAVTGSPASIANRVSYYFGFDGPSIAVDSMCSSSLTTLHLACQALALGDCDAAIAGGVNVSLHPNKYVLLEQGKFSSSTGRCQSFGAGGDGYVPSEGVGAVLLKPLARARADGDRVYGVIKATGINHGGKTNGYTVPNPNAQARLIRRVLDRAGVTADAVSYVEAHGTGTSLGDPIEITGLVNAFGTEDRTNRCLIGSVKSNIGHCESAAGVAALCKVLLQLSHGELVPSLHSAQLNPNIDFANTPFDVVQTRMPWPRPTVQRDGREIEVSRIAGISSFGAGGANAHVIVAEHLAAPLSAPSPGVHAIVLSARTEEQLRERARLLLAALKRGTYVDADLASIAYTLMVGREPMNWRLGFIADSLASVQTSLLAFIDGADAPTVTSGCIIDREEALDAFRADAAAQRALDAALAGADLATLIAHWTMGAAVDWLQLYDGARPLRIGLPSYPFARNKYWYVPPRVTAIAAGTPTPAVQSAPRSALERTRAPAPSPEPARAAPAPKTMPVAGNGAAARPKPSGIVLGAPAEPGAAPARANPAPTARLTSATPVQGDPASAPTRAEPPPRGPESGVSLEQLRRELSESFASVLFMDVADVDDRRPFGEMGMDSVLAVEWIREINKQYGVTVEALDIYDHADIRAMAKLLKERMELPGAETAVPAGPSSAPNITQRETATAGNVERSLGALRKELVQSFAKVLFMDATDVDERRPFGEMGMDSVLAVEWIRDINAQYGIAIEAVDIYDHADIRAMATLIAARLAAATNTGDTAAPAPAPQAGAIESAETSALGVDDILKSVQNGSMTVDEAERLLAGHAN